MFGTSCTLRTRDGSTWQKMPSFFRVASSSSDSPRQTMTSGDRPNPLNSLTPCCVGFVFCSPTTPRHGTSETCTRQKFSRFTWNWNCRRASKNTADSMSPTVPPTSTKQTSGAPGRPSVGTRATFSIHSWISFVTWGTTWTVLPR